MALKRSELYTLNASISTSEYSIPNGGTVLQSITTPVLLTGLIDAEPVADGDVFRVRVKEKVVSGGTQRTILDFLICNDQQTSPLYSFGPFLLLHGWDVTVIRVAGSDRTLVGRVEVSTGPNITELYGRSNTSVTNSGYSIVNNSTTPAALASPAIVQFMCHDRGNMVKADEFELAVLEKAISGGTQRTMFSRRCHDVQTVASFVTPLLAVRHGWDGVMDRIAGADRNWDMSCRGMS